MRAFLLTCAATAVLFLLISLGQASAENVKIGGGSMTAGGGFPDGGVIGTGAATQVAYWTAPHTLTGESEFFYEPTENHVYVGAARPDYFAVDSNAVILNDEGAHYPHTITALASNTGQYPAHVFLRAQGTWASPTPVSLNTRMGMIRWMGQSSTTPGAFEDAAIIEGQAQELYNGNCAHGGALFFSTMTTTNCGGTTIRMTIDGSGNVRFSSNIIGEQNFTLGGSTTYTPGAITLVALGPTTQVMGSAIMDFVCGVADCGLRLSEFTAGGGGIPDGMRVLIKVREGSTGTVTLDHVVGTQQNLTGQPVILTGPQSTEYVYSTHSGAWNQINARPVTLPQQGPLTALGPTTFTVNASDVFQGSCTTVADCGYRFSETSVVDGTEFQFRCSSASTGTCTIDNVAGQQLTVGGVSLVLTANDNVKFTYSATASAWVQSGTVVIIP